MKFVEILVSQGGRKASQERREGKWRKRRDERENWTGPDKMSIIK